MGWLQTSQHLRVIRRHIFYHYNIQNRVMTYIWTQHPFGRKSSGSHFLSFC